MCLSAITERYDPPLAEEQIAWKVVWGPQTAVMATPLPRGRWIFKDKIVAELTAESSGANYISGFHCWTSREVAVRVAERWNTHRPLFDKYSVVKVKIRGVTAKGPNNYGPREHAECIVADEIFVMEHENEQA